MGHRYDWSIDLDDTNNTLTYQVAFTGRERRVLDVGCATGYLARALAASGCTVVGVEPDEAAAEAARRDGLDVLTADFTAPDIVPRLLAHSGGQRFDVVVFGDVLEHLVDPAAALRTAAQLLDPAGCVVASIPNVAHGSLRLDLLRGRFRYTDTGLLDRTHVQLFTRERIAALFRSADFAIETEARSYYPVFGTEGRVQQGELPPEVEQLVLADRESHVYQYIVVARPAWTAAHVAEAETAFSAPAVADLVVVPIGELDEPTRLALRLSLPLRRRLAVTAPVVDAGQVAAAVADLPDDTAVLVVDADVVPEPGWLAALWDAHRAGDAPVGGAVVDAEGRLVHAGADPKGHAFGAGATWAGAPWYSADRPLAGLLPPLLARAEALRGGGLPTGRFVGAARAVRRRGVAAGPDAPLTEVFGRTALFLADVPPSQLDPTSRSQLLAGLEAVRDRGVTPVLSWTSTDLLANRLAHRGLERAGVVVVGGDPGVDAPTPELAEALSPGARALATALQPELVVYLSPARTAADAGACAVALPHAATVDASGQPGPDVDVRCDLRSIDFVPALADLLERPRAASAPRIAAIPPRATTAGLVSVVIPVWNLWHLTAACLEALRRHTPEPLEIIVVDNGSRDETPARLAAADDVTVIRNATNRGFAAACNQGIAAARGELVCLLNNDTEVTEGWLDALRSALAVPGTGLVGPRSNRISGLQVVPAAPALSDASDAHAWAHEWREQRRGRSWLTQRLVGFCLLARRELFEAIGGFDEGFGVGNYEDDDLGERVLAAGLSLRVADDAVVLHHGSATFAGLDVDWAAAMRHGGRHFRGRHGDPRLATALVLADGGGTAAAQTAADALAVADAVVVLERGALAATEVAVAAVPGDAVRVLPLDWHDDDALTPLLAGLQSAVVLVLGAGERLEAPDWGAARSDLERVDGPAALAVGAGAEVRLHPPAPDAAAAIGTPAEAQLASLRVVSPAP